MSSEVQAQVVTLKERYAQQSRAGLPFNPIDGVEIGGANVERLKHGMSTFKWTDFRFVREFQAIARGWEIKPNAPSVEILVRNDSDGTFQIQHLFNAESIEGIPSLAEMLAMTDEQFEESHEIESIDENIFITPARSLDLSLDTTSIDNVSNNPRFSKLLSFGAAPYDHNPKNRVNYYVELENGSGEVTTVWGLDLERSLAEAGAQIGDHILLTENGSKPVTVEERQPDDSFITKTAQRINWITTVQPREVIQSASTTEALSEKVPVETNLAVMATYWLDGLHNYEGIELAKEINAIIKSEKLIQNKEAISKLLSVYPKHKSLGIEIVSETRLLSDTQYKINPSEPQTLLDGQLIRDNAGAYRPKAGGSAVLQDKGDAVVLKNKSSQAYRGAMELAISKGWKSIELKGKPAMLAEAWLEARLLGLDVVNYSPNEKDKIKYAQRLAQSNEQKNKAAVEITPEIVEIRPYIDATGREKTATVTYTVSQQGGKDIPCKSVEEAAKTFAGISSEHKPMVKRSIVRTEGNVREDVVATSEKSSTNKKNLSASATTVDREFQAALANEQAIKTVAPSNVVSEVVTKGHFVGPVTASADGRISQKIGRDPDKVVLHSISNLKGAIPEIGQIVDIKYLNGLGHVKSNEQEKEQNNTKGKAR